MNLGRSFLVSSFVPLLLCASSVTAETALLSDRNGDGAVSIASFGDSLTYGTGEQGIDDSSSERQSSRAAGPGGYPAWLSSLLHLPVRNGGVPGEVLSTEGVERFVPFTAAGSEDLVIVIEGDNDAFNGVSGDNFEYALQKVINAAKILGKEPILATLPLPCCNHAAFVGPISSYSAKVRELSVANELTVADLETAFITSCANAECELYNIPEGLHPNARGYQVMAETIAATLLDIDIFASDGASSLESALGLPAGSVLVKPLITEAE